MELANTKKTLFTTKKETTKKKNIQIKKKTKSSTLFRWVKVLLMKKINAVRFHKFIFKKKAIYMTRKKI